LILKMLSRAVRKSIVDARIPVSALPPTFLLPSRARYFNSTTQQIETPSQALHSSQLFTESIDDTPGSSRPKLSRPKVPEKPASPSSPLAISKSVQELLPLLGAQPSHYISTHIHGKPYLVTIGDSIRLPFQMPGVMPGDVLRLNRATSLGSRDFTLKGAPYVDERLFECRATVIGTEAEPMRMKEKTKRRNRKVKTVKSKHKFTILRISDLKVKSLEEIQD
jgi:large subunit ribosomal protein L21